MTNQRARNTFSRQWQYGRLFRLKFNNVEKPGRFVRSYLSRLDMPLSGSKRRKKQWKVASAAAISAKEQKGQENAASLSVSADSTPVSAARRKLELFADNNRRRFDDRDSQMWCMTHVFQLSKLIGDLLCPACEQPGLTVSVVDGENAGFASKLCLACSIPECGYNKSEMTSPRLNDSDKSNVAFTINPMMVLFSHEIGGSHAALRKFSVVTGIPPMALRTYQNHDQRITGKNNYTFNIG